MCQWTVKQNTLTPSETDDDTPYFQQGAEPPPREQWEIAAPIDFFNVQEVSQISHQLDELFLSEKEV